jgi:hypothetical protein
MVGNVAFLMKDLVLLAVSFYLVKQDALRLASAASIDELWRTRAIEHGARVHPGNY